MCLQQLQSRLLVVLEPTLRLQAKASDKLMSYRSLLDVHFSQKACRGFFTCKRREQQQARCSSCSTGGRCLCIRVEYSAVILLVSNLCLEPFSWLYGPTSLDVNFHVYLFIRAVLLIAEEPLHSGYMVPLT